MKTVAIIEPNYRSCSLFVPSQTIEYRFNGDIERQCDGIYYLCQKLKEKTNAEIVIQINTRHFGIAYYDRLKAFGMCVVPLQEEFIRFEF